MNLYLIYGKATANLDVKLDGQRKLACPNVDSGQIKDLKKKKKSSGSILVHCDVKHIFHQAFFWLLGDKPCNRFRIGNISKNYYTNKNITVLKSCLHNHQT